MTAPTLKSITGQLHEAFEKWRVIDGAESMNLKAFGMALTNKGYELSKPSNGKRWRMGIALRAEDSDTDAENE